MAKQKPKTFDLIALVIPRGGKPTAMSAAQAAQLPQAQILSVREVPKGTKPSVSLFRTKAGKEGTNSPFVNISPEEKKFVIKGNFNIESPKAFGKAHGEGMHGEYGAEGAKQGSGSKVPLGRDILQPVDVLPKKGVGDSPMSSRLERMSQYEAIQAVLKQRLRDFITETKGKPTGFENFWTDTVRYLQNQYEKGNKIAGQVLDRFDTLVNLNIEKGIANPRQTAFRDFILGDSFPSSENGKGEESILFPQDLLKSVGDNIFIGGKSVSKLLQTGDATISDPNNVRDTTRDMAGQFIPLPPPLRVNARGRQPTDIERPHGDTFIPTEETATPTATPITNRDLAEYYNNITEISDPNNVIGVDIDGVTYGGATGKSWQEYSKDWQKENKENIKAGMPEDPIKSLFKKVKEKITSKKGGGRVSSRPKSYRTAKVMKQYAKGGSVRKPKRIK